MAYNYSERKKQGNWVDSQVIYASSDKNVKQIGEDRWAPSAMVEVQGEQYWTPFEDGRPGQRKLFEMKPPVITGLYRDPSVPSKVVGNLLGLAANKYTGMQPDDSLSADSAPLAQKALKRGMLQRNESNPDADVTNEVKSTPIEQPVDEAGFVHGATPISPESVKAGRETLWNTLRKGRLSSQFDATPSSVRGMKIEQPKLPGMD